MRKGGYKIISLKSSTLYEDIESNYYKPLLLTDIVIDGVDKHDLFVNVEVWDGNYIIDAYDRTISITPENQVTMTEGGKHLYVHNITMHRNDNQAYAVQILVLNADPREYNTFDLVNQNISGETYGTIASGVDSQGDGYVVFSINRIDDNTMYTWHNYIGDDSEVIDYMDWRKTSTNIVFKDTVTKVF